MAESPTVPQSKHSAIKVTPRQVKAARIAVKGYRRLGKPVPPGLQRIANAKRAS